MTKEEILKCVIEKAVKGGLFKNMNKFDIPFWALKEYHIADIDNNGDIVIRNNYKSSEYYNFHINEILFDIKFCKAMAKYILKTNQSIKIGVSAVRTGGWSTQKELLKEIEKQFKIELVLAPDRLEYMKQFIGG